MDLSLLQTLLVVAEQGALTLAARVLSLTQPGASRNIAKLERGPGTRLLDRHRGQVRLTPAGERVRDLAGEFSSREQALRSALRRPGGEVSGVLGISASTTPGEFITPN